MNCLKIFKKMLCFVTAAFILVLSGCSVADYTEDGKLSVVATVFPGYDFARHVFGGDAEVSLLIPPGAESHSFEPTPQDILKIQKCDLFVYVGGESESWVDGILSSLDKEIKTVKMIECVDAVEEKISEGMDVGREAHDHEDESGGGEKPEYDEHVWTSPANAVKIMKAVSSAAAEADPENAEKYSINSEDYISELQQLDSDFTDFFSAIKDKTLIFGDRFPLRYFADEYSLDYYAAFPGCSSSTEPSAATISFLISRVREQKISTVFYLEFSNHQIADIISEETGAKTALFHSCHNVTADEFKNGETYVSLMKKNLKVLREVLK